MMMALIQNGGKIISQPMGASEPEGILGTLYWLMDNSQSGFVTGIVVPVDGGFHLILVCKHASMNLMN